MLKTKAKQQHNQIWRLLEVTVVLGFIPLLRDKKLFSLVTISINRTAANEWVFLPLGSF